MDERGPRAVFAGDLTDPWVVSIAEALPRPTLRIDCPGPLPDRWPETALGVPAVVLHRAHLDDGDADRLRRLRALVTSPTRVVLCVGPYARHPQIERLSLLVDSVLPEASAAEVVARHVLPPESRRRRPAGTPEVAVVSANYELRLMLADALRRAGFDPHPARDCSGCPAGALAVWDVSTLEPDWPQTLAQVAALRPVIMLAGFLDRTTVSLARAAGSLACLDLPLDPADLVFVVDRLLENPRKRDDPPIHSAHGFPPVPASLRAALARRALAEPGGAAYNP